MRLEEMTIDELVTEYNRLGPVEPISCWNRSRNELVEMVRIARKQSTPSGLVDCVAVTPPNDYD